MNFLNGSLPTLKAVVVVHFDGEKWEIHSALHPQIREQMSGPDLHVFTLNFLALKQLFFSLFCGQKKI